MMSFEVRVPRIKLKASLVGLTSAGLGFSLSLDVKCTKIHRLWPYVDK